MAPKAQDTNKTSSKVSSDHIKSPKLNSNKARNGKPDVRVKKPKKIQIHSKFSSEFQKKSI